MIEILFALLLAVAFFVLLKIFFGQGYPSHKTKGDQHAWGLMIFAFAVIALSLWLLVHFIGWATIIKKLLGLFLFLFGIFMVTKFPAGSDWQPKGFTLLGAFLGLFSTFLGLYWLLF
jgi:hypothetical protein